MSNYQALKDELNKNKEKLEIANKKLEDYSKNLEEMYKNSEVERWENLQELKRSAQHYEHHQHRW